MWKILLTGATGFLGGELAVSLSKMDAVDKLVCLIRAKSPHEADQRLDRIFALHGNTFDPGKVSAIAGDLADNELAQRVLRDPVLSDINIVIHAAANTSFLDRKYAAIYETNVRGTQRLADWALQLGQLETFVYVGTATIAGAGHDVVGRTIYEDEGLNMGAEHLVGYTRSKMLGEMVVKSTIPAERLIVVRPSILLGDSRPLIPRSFDIAWIITAIDCLRMFFSNPDALCDVISVDYAAYAIVQLILARRNHTTYHISAGRLSTTSRQIWEAVEEPAFGKPPVAFCPRADLDLLKKWVRTTDGAPLAVNGYSEHFKYIQEGIGKRKARMMLCGLEQYWDFVDLNQRFDNSRLLEDTGIPLPEPAHQYLKRTAMYFEDLDPILAAANP